MNNSQQGKSRRGFLTQTIMAWFVLILAPAIYGIIRYLIPPSLQESIASTITAGKVADIPGYQDGAKLIKFNRKAVYIYKNAQNQVKALSAVCTHLGCIVEYHPNDRKFKCNCHGSVFDVDGKNISGPAPVPLPSYRVEIKNDDVVLYQS